MKKKFFRGSLFFLLTLFFVSCGNVVTLSEDTTQLTFALGDEVAVAIASRQASTTGGNYRVVMSLAGGSSQTIEQSATEETLATVPFVFKGIPIGARVRASCSVYNEDVLVWTGSSDEIKVSSSTNRGVITLGKLSGIVVWNGTSLGIRPYGTANLSSTELTLSYGEGNGQMPPFAFDNDKNLYYVDIHNNNSLYRIPYDGGKYSMQGVDSFDRDALFLTSAPVTSLCYDQVTGKLYGYNGFTFYWFNITSEGAGFVNFSLDTISVQQDTPITVTPTAAAVHNDIVYLYQLVEDDTTKTPYIFIGKLKDTLSNDAGDNLTYQTAIKLTLPHDGATVTDMMVQDGALYLLIRHVDFNSANAYSRGGIMKINLGDTPTVDRTFGDNGLFGMDTSVIQLPNKDDGTAVTYTGGGTFLGPVKFVAVVPKKLVVADWGATVASGTDYATVSKKSRLVTVDLDTLSASVETVSDSGDYYNNGDLTPDGNYFVYQNFGEKIFIDKKSGFRVAFFC